jgi:hypothetical protein
MDKHTRISTRSKNVVVMTCCKLIHTETLSKAAFYVKLLFFNLNFDCLNRISGSSLAQDKSDDSHHHR